MFLLNLRVGICCHLYSLNFFHSLRDKNSFFFCDKSNLLTMWGNLQFLSAAFQPNWTLLNVSASGNPRLLIRYHVKLSFPVCLTYLICSIPSALFPLISRKQLGWSHLSTGSHLGCCSPVDFTHGAILLCRFLEAVIPQVCLVRLETGI